jgi:acyl transferase domain-containing protein
MAIDERSSPVNIAVVGLPCRRPAATPDEFWRLLRFRKSVVTCVPDSRSGTDFPPRGGFPRTLDEFPPSFFGISPREAVEMDPQRQVILELGWRSLEDTEIVPENVPEKARGSRAGVFIGSMWDDHAGILDRRGATETTRYTLTGAQPGMIDSRLSYSWGLRSPNMIALSPDGRCFTFDARADGCARGDGGGLVPLRRLTRPLVVGSATTDVGHLEGAGGVGLIKTALSIRYRELPASLETSREPESPDFPGLCLDALNLRVQQEHGRWPNRTGRWWPASVRAGLGGTNCRWCWPSPACSGGALRRSAGRAPVVRVGPGRVSAPRGGCSVPASCR